MSTIWAKPELDEAPVDDDAEVPRLPALVPDEDAPEADDDVPLEEADGVPEETASPGERLSRETTVPLVGALKLVAAREISALRTLASAL